jgi:hypothetical protein
LHRQQSGLIAGGQDLFWRCVFAWSLFSKVVDDKVHKITKRFNLISA